MEVADIVAAASAGIYVDPSRSLHMQISFHQSQQVLSYSNHSETSEKYFVINLQYTEHTVSGASISFIDVREHTMVII